MVEITLPIPAFLSYFWKNAISQYEEWHQRSNDVGTGIADTISYLGKFRRITQTHEHGIENGAIIAHFAESTAIKILINAVSTI